MYRRVHCAFSPNLALSRTHPRLLELAASSLLNKPRLARYGVNIRLIVAALLACGAVHAQDLYKYRGADGEWIYSDKAPDDGDAAEVRELPLGVEEPEVRVTQTLVDGHIRVVAVNDFHAPVEIVLAVDEIPDLVAPPAAKSLRTVLAPRSETQLLWLETTATRIEEELRFLWLLGDPGSAHAPPRDYRAPFAIARSFPVSQAYPEAVTHQEPDSRHAVDLAMPIGTGIYAARAGTVVEVASTNYRGGTDAVSLVQGARAHKLRPRPQRIDDLSGLSTLPRASILHWEFNHFVVFQRVKVNLNEFIFVD